MDIKNQDALLSKARETKIARWALKCLSTLKKWIYTWGIKYVGKRMMEMAVPGRRKRGRPRRRWMDLVREDMERVGAREGDEVDRVKWRLLSRCGDPE